MGNANGYKVSASGRWCGKDVNWTRHFMVLSAQEALDRAQKRWEEAL
jgi:hypothetical protein